MFTLENVKHLEELEEAQRPIMVGIVEGVYIALCMLINMKGREPVPEIAVILNCSDTLVMDC